jgi:hypothetical protein
MWPMVDRSLSLGARTGLAQAGDQFQKWAMSPNRLTNRQDPVTFLGLSVIGFHPGGGPRHDGGTKAGALVATVLALFFLPFVPPWAVGYITFERVTVAASAVNLHCSQRSRRPGNRRR